MLFIPLAETNHYVHISLSHCMLGMAGADLEEFLKHILSVRNVLFLR